MNSEFLGLLIGLVLTLFIYSYLLGDNWFYRLAVHILVGVSAAYAAVIAFEEIFLPLFNQFRADPGAPANLLWFIPLLFSVLLLFVWIRPVAWVSNGAVALLVGTGAAVALVGVIGGTLIPQVLATPGEGALWQLVIALLTICALLYFQFTGRENGNGTLLSRGRQVIGWIGQGVLMITFGALFASALTTSLVLLTDRLSYFVGGLLQFVDGLLS
jgi:hypothetical protein